jgi:hypothetical protein
MKRLSFLGTLGLLLVLALAPAAARAGVATAGAVLLDPFDPVPEIQFHHYGGYGCNYGCGGCDYACNRCGYDCYRHSRCGEGCYRGDCDGCYRHSDCNDTCYRRTCDGCYRHTDCRDGCRPADCDHDCHDGDTSPPPTTCLQGNCYDAEHYERRWRDGNRVGQEWMDRGRKERIIPADARPHGWGRGSENWYEDDDDPPPPPPPPASPPHH